MSEPTQTCQLCGNSVEVDFYARGFPPDAAAKKLKKLCKSQGCPCAPKYRAGIDVAGFTAILSDTSTEGAHND